MVDKQSGQRGIALVIVIFALVLVSLLGASLLLSTLSTELDSADLEAERAAYTQAELGAQAALDILRGHGGPKSSTKLINLYIAVNEKTKIDPTDLTEKPLARMETWLPSSYQMVKRYARARSGLSQTLADTYMVVTNNSRPSEPQGYSLVLKSEAPDVPEADPFPAGTTPAQVTSIRVTSTGYGPRGAVKAIRLVVGKPVSINLPSGFLFNDKPGTFTVNGNASKKKCQQTFDTRDYANSPPSGGVPIVAYTDTSVQSGFQSDFNSLRSNGCTVQPGDGQSDTVNATTLPNWNNNQFSSYSSVQKLINTLTPYANYNGPAPTTNNTAFGSAASPQIVIIQGNLALSGNSSFTGGGILVVTGNLDLKGTTSFSWKGLVLVLGDFNISGSPDFNVEGGVAVVSKNGSGSMTWSGDFNFTLKYNSSLINSAVSNFPLSVKSEY